MEDQEGQPPIAAIDYVETKPEDKERPQLGVALDGRHVQLSFAGVAALKAATGEDVGTVDAAAPRWEREAEARKRDLALYLTNRVEQLEAGNGELQRQINQIETRLRALAQEK